MPATFAQAMDALAALAPLRLAEEWDNVGLLIEPLARLGSAGQRRELSGVLLAIDATDAVVEEAVRRACDLVVAYHPPVFAGLKALRASTPRGRALVRALRYEVAIYSPHTALDAAAGGIGDWLAAAFGRVESEPLRPAPGEPPGVGQGRWLRMQRPHTLAAIAAKLRKHLGVERLRLARSLVSPAARVQTVALAAGAGGTLLMERLAAGGVDLLFTGEMRHHDVLAATEAGSHVLLAEHTHTERGYLPVLRTCLRRHLPGVPIHLARADREPLAPM